MMLTVIKSIRHFLKRRIYFNWLELRRKFVRWHLLKPYRLRHNYSGDAYGIHVDATGWDSQSGTTLLPLYSMQEAVDRLSIVEGGGGAIVVGKGEFRVRNTLDFGMKLCEIKGYVSIEGKGRSVTIIKQV
jgi:hypothetical protein